MRHERDPCLHREDRGERSRTWRIDPYATGWAFDGWKEREGEPFVWKVPEEYKPIPVWRPRSWLLRTGWRKYGLIRVREVPSEPVAMRVERRRPHSRG